MTAVFDLSDRVVEGTAASDPVAATFMGVAGYDTRLTDYSGGRRRPAGGRGPGLARRARRRAAADDADRLAAAHLRERLVDPRACCTTSGEHLRDCNVIGSPVQYPRQAFTLLPTASEADWATVAARLEAVPAPLASLRSGVRQRDRRRTSCRPAARCSAPPRSPPSPPGLQAEPGADAAAWFDGFVAALRGRRTSRCARGSRGRRGSHRGPTPSCPSGCATRTPHAATERDAVGPERYAPHGADPQRHRPGPRRDVRLGLDDLARITARMNDCAGRLYGGVTPAEAQARLDVDPEHTIEGAEPARDWLQRITDETTPTFDGTYFDIPEQMRRCEAMLAPPGGAAAPYYTPPCEDFCRPGRTWLPASGRAVPDLVADLVWYHEAVPAPPAGRHTLRASGSPGSSGSSSSPGHAEGWALYAERLMDELGYLDSPAPSWATCPRQALRATRVVLDIGLHLGLPIPGRRGPGAAGEAQGDPRGAVDAASSPGSSWRPRALSRSASRPARSTATSGCPGRRSPTRSASGCGWPPARRRGQPPGAGST